MLPKQFYVWICKNVYQRHFLTLPSPFIRDLCGHLTLQLEIVQQTKRIVLVGTKQSAAEEPTKLRY